MKEKKENTKTVLKSVPIVTKGKRGFNKGHKKAGGRKPGTQNKLTTSAKQAFQDAFDNLGGTKALTKWAKRNQTAFYNLYGRSIPVDVKGNLNLTSKTLIIKDDA